MSDLPRTKQGADALKVKFYDTGKPCKNGHLSPKCAKNYGCVECNRLKQSEYYYNRTPEQKARAKLIAAKYQRDHYHERIIKQIERGE